MNNAAFLEGFDSRELEVTSKPVLQERVDNHITFGKIAFGICFAWLGWLSVTLIDVKSTMQRVEIAQANAPAKIVASLLSQPITSKEEAASNLTTVATLLQTSKIGVVRPSPSVIQSLGVKLADDQNKYRELPQLWQATSAFINYKSAALNPNSSKIAGIAKGVPCHLGINFQASFTNCEFNLEDVTNNFKGNAMNGRPIPFVFEHCIIHYHGGVIPPARLIFDDCLLRFDVQAIPPSSGMIAMERLTLLDTRGNFEISS